MAQYFPNIAQPDILGSYQQGVNQARTQQAGELAGQAYGADPTARKPILARLTSLNPQLGVALGNSLATQDANAAQQQQATLERQHKQIVGMAQGMLAAYQSGNPARIQGTYAAMRPQLEAVAKQHDPNAVVPEQFSPDMLEPIYSILSQAGGQVPEPKLTVIGAGSTALGPDGKPVFTSPERATGELATLRAIQQDPSLVAAYRQLHPQAVGGGATGQFAKNKAFADQLRAAGVITTPEDYNQVLMTGKVGTDFQGASNVKPFGDESKTGAEYLQTLSGANADIVKGLLNGTVQLPTGTALKNGFWQSALASVKHADPSWNQAAYQQFATTRRYMTTGQGGKLINSINTGAQHLQKLVDDIEALDNSNVRPLAAASNYLSKNLGGQAVTNFIGDITPVASELASIYKNGGTPTDQETQHWREALDPNMSRAQQLNVVRGWIDLLAGKLNATHDQYRSAMSPLSEPLNVINPKAAQALEKITALANSVSTTGQHETPAADQAPINAPGQQAPQQADGWSIQRVQ